MEAGMLKIGDFSRLSQVSIKTLRYYAARELLPPAHIDPATGYRYYTAAQLPRLNRILALKDLGLSLEQIGALLEEGPPPEQIAVLLRDRRAAIERQIAEEQARLARVESRLRQIQREGQLPAYEVVVKPVAAMRVAAVRARVPSYAEADDLFARLMAYLRQHRIDPAASYPVVTLYHDDDYRERDPDMTAAVPVPRVLPDDDNTGGRVITLPAVDTMACVVHRGPYDDFAPAYTALLAFIAENAYSIAGPNRQVHLVSFPQTRDPGEFVTEIQFPVLQ